jgi:hypothetical protein
MQRHNQKTIIKKKKKKKHARKTTQGRDILISNLIIHSRFIQEGHIWNLFKLTLESSLSELIRFTYELNLDEEILERNVTIFNVLNRKLITQTSQ